MRERDPRPVGGAVIESERASEPELERGVARNGWNPFILCLAVLAAASWAVLVGLESHLTFYADEWDFLLRRRGWSVGDFLDPHVDHIALAPVSIYKFLLATFGMDSPLPFQVISTLVFLLSAVLLFVYLRRRVGDWPALLGSALILFLGAGWTDLLWPFQIGFSGSIAAGLGAHLALDRDDHVGDRIACALLVVSLSFSELGVPFIAGALVRLFLERPWISRLYVVLVPVGLYAIWWLGWGYQAESAFSLDNVLESPKWVFDAASQAAASVVGLGTPTGSVPDWRYPVGLGWGRILLVAGIALGAWRFSRLDGVPRSFWVALAIGASFWFLTAFNAVPLVRTPTTGRYQYPGAVFLVLIAGELLRGMRVNRRALALGSAVTALAVLSGLWFVHLGYSKQRKPLSDQLGAQLAAIEIARDRVDPGLIVDSASRPIDSGSYLSAVDAYGSPAYSESELASIPDAARVAADEVLVQGLGIELGRARGSPSRAGDQDERRCRQVAATPSGATGVALGPGEVTLKPRSGASTEVWLGRFADGFSVRLGRLVRGRASSLTIPTDRSSRPWRLGLGPDGRAIVCQRPNLDGT